ncbi:MAG: ABC transporter ATP-binding protein [Bacillota bacterium]
MRAPSDLGNLTSAAIEVRDVSKTFQERRGMLERLRQPRPQRSQILPGDSGGPKPVLAGINLEVRRGELFGLIGANGAGKTTLIKILTGILSADQGVARVNGFDLRAQRTLAKASTTLIKSGGWTGLAYQVSVLENLRFYGRLAGLNGRTIEERAKQILDRLGLGDMSNELPWFLSAGQRQKASLAMMSMVITPVVFLDEPTTHLDPAAADDVRRFVRDVMNRERGQTIFMSTHYLDEAEQLCDRIAILDHGHLLASGTPAQLAASLPDRAVLQISADECTPVVVKQLASLPGIQHVKEDLDDGVAGRCLMHIYGEPTATIPTSEVLRCLDENGARLRWIKTTQPTLQEVYFSLVGRDIA